jgi:hypothetical protein
VLSLSNQTNQAKPNDPQCVCDSAFNLVRDTVFKVFARMRDLHFTAAQWTQVRQCHGQPGALSEQRVEVFIAGPQAGTGRL